MPADTHLFQVFFESTSPCLLRPLRLSSTLFWHPVHCCRCGSFSLQSEDVAGHFPSPCTDNVLESLHACPPHHLLVGQWLCTDVVAPVDNKHSNQAADRSRPADGNNVVMTMWLLHARNAIGAMRIKTCYNR